MALLKRRILWFDTENLAGQCNDPWCVVGDFNNVLRSKDHIGGRMVVNYEFCDLQSMMDICNLVEMENQGEYFT